MNSGDIHQLLTIKWFYCQKQETFWKQLTIIKTLYSCMSRKTPRIIFCAINNTTHMKYIVKMIRSNTSSLPEVEKSNMFLHPNLVHFEKATKIDDWWIVCSKFAEKGDFVQLLEKKKIIEESFARKLFTQLLEALKTLHSAGYAHKDVKLDNLLLTERNEVILTDFEFCERVLKKTESSWGGTFLYASPEVRRRVHSGCEADMWSAGVTLFSLVYGRFPFSTCCLNEQKEEETLKEIQEEDEMVSDCCKDILYKLLNPDPLKRITAKEALRHPWCQEPKDLHWLLENQMIGIPRKNLYHDNFKIKRIHSSVDISPSIENQRVCNRDRKR